MPLGLGLRFVVETVFLIAVAIAAGILSLSTPAIVGVMAGAWLVVAAVEWGVSRRAASRAKARVVAPGSPAAPVIEQPRPEPVVEPEPLPEPVPPAVVTAPVESAPEGAPPPLPEPVPPAAEPVVPVAEVTAAADEEPVPAPGEAERPALVPVPAPPPEPEPALEPARAEVVRLAGWGDDPREWNLWDLERAARESSGQDVALDEERAFLLMYLRDFAGPDGSLPSNFDGLVRDSFGDLLGTVAQ